MASKRDWLAGGDRHAAAVAALHAAARRELRERGPDRFSVEAVARRAGCSRATLYRTVGGKSALLDAVLADAAAVIRQRIEAGIAGLEGPDRATAAILVGLREIRADRATHDWVRHAILSSDFLQRSSTLAEIASGWVDAPASPGLQPQPAGEWLLRVFLSFIAWPMPDADSEARLVASFVAPSLGTPPERGSRVT